MPTQCVQWRRANVNAFQLWLSTIFPSSAHHEHIARIRVGGSISAGQASHQHNATDVNTTHRTQPHVGCLPKSYAHRCVCAWIYRIVIYRGFCVKMLQVNSLIRGRRMFHRALYSCEHTLEPIAIRCGANPLARQIGPNPHEYPSANSSTNKTQLM